MRQHRRALIVGIVAATCRLFGYVETAEVIAFVSVIFVTQTLFGSRMSWGCRPIISPGDLPKNSPSRLTVPR